MEDKEIFGLIYKATNIQNGKVYIGQTIRTLRRRKNEHKRYAFNYNSDFAFHRALRKYGENNFTWETIDTAKTLEELNEKENHWIATFNSHIHSDNSNGYNHTYGGDGIKSHKHSEQSKQKMSDTKKRIGSAKGSNNSKAKLTEENVVEIKELIKSGLSFSEIANQFNVSPETISSIKSGKTWTGVGEDLSDFQYTQRIANSKLTEEEIKVIKLLLKVENLKQKEIVEMINTTYAVVNNIKTNKRWKHVLLNENDKIPYVYLEKVYEILEHRNL